MNSRSKDYLFSLLILSFAVTACTESALDVPAQMEPRISSFAPDMTTITVGEDADGDWVQSQIALSWKVSVADDVLLFANGEELDIDDCEPVFEDHPCTHEGTLYLAPEENTDYELRALRQGQDCTLDDDTDLPLDPEQCDIQRTSVEVVPPARVAMEATDELINYGEDTSISYEFENAHSWELGILGSEDGTPIVDPCVPESDDDGTAFCVLPDANGVPLSEGTIDFEFVREDFFFIAFADNGADDNLGRVTVEHESAIIIIEVDGELIVHQLSTQPADDNESMIRPFSEAEISWTTENAASIRLSAEPSDAVSQEDLELCVEVNDNSGSCMIDIFQGDADGNIEFSAIAIDAIGEESEPTTIVTSVVDPVEIVNFTLDWTGNDPLEAGDSVELFWETEHAIAVLIEIDAWLDGSEVTEPVIEQDEIDACIENGHDEPNQQGSCTVTILNDVASETEIEFSLMAVGITEAVTTAQTLSTVLQ